MNKVGYKLLIVKVFFSLLPPLFAISIAPPIPVAEMNETVWFGVSDTRLVTVSPEGTARCWELPAVKPVSSFELNNFDFGNSVGQPFWVFDSESLFGNACDMYESGQQPYLQVDIYDISTGGLFKTVKIPYPDRLIVFNSARLENKRLILYYSTIDAGILIAVDVETGRKLFEYTFGSKDSLCTLESTEPMIKITERPELFVSFSENLVVANNRKGENIWKKRFKSNTERIDLAEAPPPGHIAVLVAFPKTDDGVKSKVRYFAINMHDGDIVWERVIPYNTCRALYHSPYPPFHRCTGGFRAVSCRGGIQVWSSDGNNMELTYLPNDKVIKVPEVKYVVDAVFTPNEKYLVCLPAFNIVETHEDKANRRILTFGRKSQLVTIIDAQGGKIVNESEIKHGSIASP